MATPSKKAPVLETFLDGLAYKQFGRTRTESIKEDRCLVCGGEANVFNDLLSKKEYTISGMCQECQDETFTRSD